MVPPPRPGTFSPNPTAQPIYTGINHSPHPSHAGALSAAASPSTSSPTGSNSLTKIAVAQVYLLLSTIKEDKDDPRKWESQIESLRKVTWCPCCIPSLPFSSIALSGSLFILFTPVRCSPTFPFVTRAALYASTGVSNTPFPAAF